VLDPRFLIGLIICAVWVALMVRAWRRRRTIELLGLGWIAIAYLPVANILFPIGILTAERTLYLPSVGLVLAVGAWLAALPERQWGVLLVGLVALGSIRTFTRVPVWRSEDRLTLSILEDSPSSYIGPFRAADRMELAGHLDRSLAYLRISVTQCTTDPRPFYSAADIAKTLHQPALADSMLARADALCARCTAYYERRAERARMRGDTATARWLLDRTKAWAPK
jgi:hypothetical protein